MTMMNNSKVVSLIRGGAYLLLLLACVAEEAEADDRKKATDLIRSRGFNVDEFDVMSQNYVLKVYRIINPLADPKKLHKVPVVCHHGIVWDASNMLSASKLSRPRKPRLDERVTLYTMDNGTDDRGLHFYLSNNNYDVWLLEARAVNSQTRRRLNDGSNLKTFWDFSLDEQALMDLPTQIDFVLHKTKQPQIAYVAYSQSTSLMFALLSMRPEYAEKLACFIAMAPIFYSSHMSGAVRPMAFAKILTSKSSARPVVPEWYRRIFNLVNTYICSVSFIKYTVCRLAWIAFAGVDNNARLDGGTTEDVLKSTSFKTIEQFWSNHKIDEVRMYDYKDEMLNMENYGQPVPPLYNVSKIRLKTISLFRGTSDLQSDPQDQMLLLKNLRVPLYEDHILENYAHIDFIVSPSVVRDLNEPILRILDETTGRKVARVSHALDINPNPGMDDTPPVLDAKTDEAVAKSLTKTNVLIGDKTRKLGREIEEPKPVGGVQGNPNATVVRKHLLGYE